MRILFVDDEGLVVNGIRNAMLFAPEHWEADFATSGSDAIEMVTARFYDVLVSDMQMPVVTGADVLQAAKDHSPQTIRIILSGEANAELAERGIPLAHEFVSKPTEPSELFAAIERIDAVARSVAEVTRSELLSAVELLPTQANHYHRLQACLARGAEASEIAALVQSDLAIAARVLRMANSGFYGFNRPTESVRDAVVRLGSRTIAGITLQAELGGWVDERHLGPLNALNEHAMETGRQMDLLLGREVPQAGLVGLMHDIGRLLLLARRPEDYLAAGLDAQDQTGDHQDLARIEQRAFGITHAELGAAMLEIWRTDRLVVEAVRHHHDGDRLDGPVGRLIEGLAPPIPAALEQGDRS